MVAAAGLALALLAAHALSEPARLGRALRRATRHARAVLRSIEAERGRRLRAFDRVLRAHVDQAALRRLAAAPLEALRSHGAERVRWAALREAGLRTVADLVGVTRRRLAELPGIGPTSALRLSRAVRRATRSEARRPPELPAPELPTPIDLELGSAALALLDLDGALAPLHPELRTALEELARDGRGRQAGTGLQGWLLAALSPARRARLRAATEDLRATVAAWRADDRAGELEARWSRFGAAEPDAPRTPAEVRAGLVDRYAELCALVEAGWERAGLAGGRAGRAARGGLPEAVAARVEALELATVGLAAELRAYQRFGAKYLLAQERTILGDEMGLGKTVQALAAMTHLHARDGGGRFLVVAPAGLVWNWVREARRWAPFPARPVHGPRAEDELYAWRQEGGLAVTSYATLRGLAARGAVLAPGERVDFLVADEAHYLKNPEAGRTRAVAGLLERAERVSLLSGTPLENHPREFLSLIRLVQPRVAARLARAGDFERAGGGLGALSGAFHGLVAGVYLRRNQADVLRELPERIEVEEWVELSPDEARAYAQCVERGDFMAMRRATTASAGAAAPAKLERLEELLEDHRESGRKVVVFSFFLDALDEVQRRFGASGRISGAVPPEERVAVVDRFQAVEGHALLLCQIESAGTGLNLQAASVVCLLEPQLKPTTEDQAVARAHRMGQTRRVIVHRLLARGTIDERLRGLVGEKRALFDAYARESAVGELALGGGGDTARRLVRAEQEALRGPQGRDGYPPPGSPPPPVRREEPGGRDEPR